MNRDVQSNIGEDLDVLLDRAADRGFELEYVKRSGSFRLAEKLRQKAAAVKRAPEGLVRVRALGRAGEHGGGPEAWLLRASAMAGEPGTPWQYVQLNGFSMRPAMIGAHGRCAVATEPGELTFVGGTDPELAFQSHPWSGLIEVEYRGRREVVDLHCTDTRELIVRPARSPMVTRRAEDGTITDAGGENVAGPTKEDAEFLARCAAQRPVAVAVHCPRWLGISAATRNLFRHVYCVPASPEIDPHTLDEGSIERHARVLAESGVPHVVISGGDLVQQRLAERLKALRPGVTIDVLYHGSYIQLAETYEWSVVQGLIDLHRAGVIRGISTVKAGMEAFFRSIGVPSALVLNLVPGEVMQPPDLPDGAIYAGMWISGVSARKCPHAMLSALAILGNAHLHAAGMDPRAVEFVQAIRLPVARLDHKPLPHPELMQAMRRTHVTMYVTFSECCPMLPLESLTMGVPCLLGPVSHLFEEDRYLFERLVVPFPDRADVIARYTRRAAEERREIVAAYAAFATEYNQRALASAKALVEEGPTL